MAQAELRTRGGKPVFLARVFYKGKKKFVGDKYYENEADANKAIKRAETRIKAGLSPFTDDDGTPTFREFVDHEYWANLNSALKKSTLDDYRQTLKCVLDDERYTSVTIADRPIGTITHTDINKFLQEFGKTHSDNYLHKISTRIYQVMDMAANEYEFVNPMDNKKFNKPAMPNRSRVDISMTVAEAHRIIEAADAHGDYLWRTMLTVMLLSGVRRSELLGLTADSIQMDDSGHATVYVNQQWDWKSRRLVPNTKTEQGKRHIPIHIDTYRMLQKWISDLRPKNPPHDLLFIAPEGDVWKSESVWARAYNVRVKWAGIKPSRKKSSHQLRHLYAAMSLEKGVPIALLSERMGHADSSFTLDRYVHLLNKKDRTGVDEVTSALVPPIALDQPYQRNIL